MVVNGFSTKSLLFCIFIVLLMLGCCVTIDYASNDTICNIDNKPMEINNKSIIVMNDTSTIRANELGVNFVASSSDKIYTVKEKKKKKPNLPTITMWAKPSVRSGYSYTWHKFTWIDYCPNCRHYNVLLKNPKGVPEREYTCRRCDSDFCAVTGKEKYDWSHKYLRRA